MAGLICIIPAKGSSKRLAAKNIRPFFGKPIISYSIEIARASGLFKRVIVATDSVDVADVAKGWGAGVVMRPPWLSADTCGPVEVAAYVLEQVKHDALAPVCVLYATAPLMSISDLARGLDILQRNELASYAFSIGTEPLRDAAQFIWGDPWSFKAKRQVFEPHSQMVPIEDARVCDINTMDDWYEAERKYESLMRVAA